MLSKLSTFFSSSQYPEEAAAIRHILEKYGFEVTEIRFVDKVGSPRTDLNWAYINFLQVGNKIIMPIFNIKEDAIAWQYIHEAFSDKEKEQWKSLPKETRKAIIGMVLTPGGTQWDALNEAQKAVIREYSNTK